MTPLAADARAPRPDGSPQTTMDANGSVMAGMQDPMQVLELTLNATFRRVAKPAYLANLYALTTLLTLSLLASTASLVLRYRAGGFWLFRLHSTKHGSVVQPHSILGWIVSATVFAVVAIPYLWATRGSGSSGGWTVENPFAYRTLVFFVLWLGGWTMAIATLVAPAMISTRDQSRHDVTRYPWLFNTVALGVPLLFVATLTPTVVLGHIAMDRSYASYLVLLGIINSPPPVSMQGLMAATADLEAANTDVLHYWKSCWGIYGALMILSVAAFGYASFVYFRVLLSSMSAIKRQQGSSTPSQLRNLAGAYASLVSTTATTLLISGIYILITFTMAIFSTQIARSPTLPDAISLGAVYVFCVAGGITNIVILVRSYQIYGARLASTSSIGSTTAHAGRLSTLPFIRSQAATLHSFDHTSSGIMITREQDVKFDEYASFGLDLKEIPYK